MVEPLGEDPAGALTEAGAIENVLADVLAYRPALHL